LAIATYFFTGGITGGVAGMGFSTCSCKMLGTVGVCGLDIDNAPSIAVISVDVGVILPTKTTSFIVVSWEPSAGGADGALMVC